MARHLINHILAGASHVLRDERVELVLERLYAGAQRAADEAADDELGDFGYAPRPGQGEFLYLLGRATAARRVVELATSEGATALYLAAALRDNGGGTVLSWDDRPDKRERAAANLAEAGLAELVELHGGELAELAGPGSGDPVDLVYLDGWPELRAPSRALRALEALRPALRPGALVLNDGGEPDYLDHVRGPAGGFRTSVTEFGVLSVFAP